MVNNKKNIHGVFLLDKPLGITSTRALAIVKRSLNAKKAGHTGTLDPMATGLLPILLGRATKFSQLLIKNHKTYISEIKLGRSTDTGDVEGNIISESNKIVSEQEIITQIYNLVGDIIQIPPIYSAIKCNGKPLYWYARNNKIPSNIKSKSVTIHYISILFIEYPYIRLKINCSSGTYIRSLATDLGDRLGTGSHLIGLRRECISNDILLENSHDINSIDESKLLPIDSVLASVPRLDISKLSDFLALKRVEHEDMLYDKLVRVYYNGEFIAIASFINNICRPFIIWKIDD